MLRLFPTVAPEVVPGPGTRELLRIGKHLQAGDLLPDSRPELVRLLRRRGCRRGQRANARAQDEWWTPLTFGQWLLAEMLAETLATFLPAFLVAFLAVTWLYGQLAASPCQPSILRQWNWRLEVFEIGRRQSLGR